MNIWKISQWSKYFQQNMDRNGILARIAIKRLPSPFRSTATRLAYTKRWDDLYAEQTLKRFLDQCSLGMGLFFVVVWNISKICTLSLNISHVIVFIVSPVHYRNQSTWSYVYGGYIEIGITQITLKLIKICRYYYFYRFLLALLTFHWTESKATRVQFVSSGIFHSERTAPAFVEWPQGCAGCQWTRRSHSTRRDG